MLSTHTHEQFKQSHWPPRDVREAQYNIRLCMNFDCMMILWLKKKKKKSLQQTKPNKKPQTNKEKQPEENC